MTQPFDPYNPPNAAIGVRAGMFDGAIRCPNPRCGFATSDLALYECPACGIVWRQRPKKPEPVAPAPATGTPVSLVCFLCNQPFTSTDVPVFAGGADLAHASCLNKPPAEPEVFVGQQELPFGYLQVVEATEKPKPKRKRRRRRKRKPAPQEVPSGPVSD